MQLTANYDAGQAESLNNLAFVSIVRMDYQEAMRLLDTIPELTDNQLELLISYVQQMRLCQRMSRNRAFYDYREQAKRSLQRLNEEREQLPERLQRRLVYAETELSIVTSTYYYYVGLEQKSVDELSHLPSVVEQDTAQLLNYLYNVGAGGIITQGTQEEINQQEFDYLMRCFLLARQQGYSYFAANAMEALAEHLMNDDYRGLLIEDNLPAMKYINPEGISADQLPLWLADNALATFREYGDAYQIAGAYRTLASCHHAQGDDESALFNLELALADERVNQAPDLVASIREQLSVAYAALDDKLQSDLNRNIYLDLQEQTRQDRSLEARAGQLDEQVGQLNALLLAVALLVGVLVVLLLLFAYWHWRQQKKQAVPETSAEEEELREQLALHQLHVANNKRRAAEQRAKVSLVTSITPFIDRMLLEVKRLDSQPAKHADNLEYIRELTDKINEQNDVLTHWIQLQKGELNVRVESFALQPLFELVAKGRMSFRLKGVTLDVVPSEAVVKADRVLTLFMLNTLADNARKFTEAGGTVTIEAQEAPGFVEISVSDTGIGMTVEQLAHVFEHKIVTDHQQASHGFGLLNCRGIIDKYRKMSQLFAVCLLSAESRVGQGSRFFFRLPKGVVRLMLLLLFPATSALAQDDVLSKAKQYADSAYFANIAGQYERTLSFADSCRSCLNTHYRALTDEQATDTLLPMGDLSVTPPEVSWLHNDVRVNYNVILDLRNESAVAALALHQWEVYAYNNRIYTQLFKELSADTTLDEYCRKMQQSQANKTTAIILLVVVLLAILAAVALQVLHSLNQLALRRKEQQAQLELLRDELHKVEQEEACLHVSNAVLDNCLSSLKHETMYFPSRILQLVERGEYDALPEVASYYRDLYGILSEQALRQTEGYRLYLQPLDHELLGDKVLVELLFDVLRRQSGQKQLQASYRALDASFVEVSVPIPALHISEQQALHLFEPAADHLPYMLCRQIVREHGQAINRTDVGIRAELIEGQACIIMKLPRIKICKTLK